MAEDHPTDRDSIWSEVIGGLPNPPAANPRTRLIYDEPKFRGYEVMLDVWPDVFAYGILLVPEGHQARASAGRWWSASTDWKDARRTSPTRGGQPLLPPLRRAAGRAGLRDLLATEPLHRRGSFPPDPAQGPSR